MAITFSSASDYLDPGVHSASVSEVKDALVNAFGNSRTRRPIFDEWLQLRTRIGEIVTLGNQWINGSFATKKPDPKDIDVATFLDSLEVDQLDRADQEELNGLMGAGDTDGFPSCDSFALVAYPPGHPMYGAYEQTKDTFETIFYGYDSRTQVEKGFVEVAP